MDLSPRICSYGSGPIWSQDLFLWIYACLGSQDPHGSHVRKHVRVQCGPMCAHAYDAKIGSGCSVGRVVVKKKATDMQCVVLGEKELLQVDKSTLSNTTVSKRGE